MTRPTEVHEHPCRSCPSAHYLPDEEALDVRELVRRREMARAEAVFPCGWRPERLCRGFSDFIDEPAA